MAGGDSQGKASGRGDRGFGARLRRLREAAGLTQEELAGKAGLTAKAISMLERGERKRPYPHTVRALTDALGLPEDERVALLAAVPARGGAAVPRVPFADGRPPAGDEPAGLPVPPTPLVGREEELGEVRAFLLGEEVRLLTLTGAGGVGKTRLALKVARCAAGHFPDGVAFVALAPLGDPALVIPTVARSLDVREAEGQSADAALRAHLRDKRLLLVLDNFEHVIGAASEVSGLMEACLGLTALVTSRAPLRVRGEQEYPVMPLALPASTRDPSVEEVVGSPSGHLFVERARAASPAFGIKQENAAAVAAICWRLAGLPLALELVAARVRFLSPSSLLPRLDRALSTGWPRDLPERQRTMRATLDWSHDLLNEPQQRLFGRLSVFAGGFSLEAAEAIGAAEDQDAEDVLDLLGGLVEQSLVTADPGEKGDGTRYGMLEPVRQYARERLEESGKIEAVRREHAAFFLQLTERAHSGLRGPRQVEWLERLERENGNLRAAVGWALAEGEADIAGRLVWGSWLFWLLRGHHGEGRGWAEALLKRDLPPALRPRVLHVAAATAYTQGDYGACEGYSEEALELSMLEGDVLVEAYARCELGLVAMNRGDLKTAKSRFEEALPLFGRSGEEGVVPLVRAWLGTVLLLRGDHACAIPVFEEGLEQARRRGDRIGVYSALYNLGQVALSRNDHELATRMLEEGVALSEEMRDRANLAYFLEGLAVVAGARGQAERSARLFGASEGLLREVGASVYNYYTPDRSLYERTATDLRSRLGESAFEEAWAEGWAMDFEQAVAFALGEVPYGGGLTPR